MLPSLLLIAAVVAGQTRAAEVRAVPEGPNFVAADDSGKRWHSPDREWLQTYVASVNAHLKHPPASPSDGSPPTAGQTPPAVGASTPVLNYGVDTSRIGHSGREWYGGNVATVISDAGRDHAGRIHLTVIGAGASDVVAGWKASRAFGAVSESMGDKLAVQAFNDPANPLVSKIGLVAGGRPDVVIQSSDGKVLARWKDDPGGDVVAGHLRRLNPSYRPELDPEGFEALGIRVKYPVPTGLAILVVLLLLRKAAKP